MSTNDKNAWRLVPVDDNDRSVSDSIIPIEMIMAGSAAIDQAEDDLRNYKSGVTIDWDSGMIAVAVYRAMLAASPEPPASPAEGVVVKPLVWRDVRGDGSLVADSAFGPYYASETWWGPRNYPDAHPASGIEAAKAAAQSDFEQRVRSCLTASPISAAEHAAVVAEKGRLSAMGDHWCYVATVNKDRAETAEAALIAMTADRDALLKSRRGFADRLAVAEASLVKMTKAAQRVCWFDWSDSDHDAASSVERLRALIRAPSGKGDR